MNLDKFKWMVEAQNKVNLKVSPDWVQKGKTLEFDFKLAASQEMAEFFNSYGYSWWSKSPRDIPNAVTEIVDAWHFIISEVIIEYGLEFAPSVLNNAHKLVEESLLGDVSDIRVKNHAKNLVGALNKKEELSSVLNEFFLLIRAIELTLDYLYLRYMGKNCLNVFRQENGYKTGEYKKIWTGREDNYYLVEFIDTVEPSTVSYEDVHAFLTKTYAEHNVSIAFN